jgi:hypothetical protein
MEERKKESKREREREKEGHLIGKIDRQAGR